MAQLLERGGYRAAPVPEKAEVLIVNTCGYLGPAKEESFQVLEEMAAHKRKGQLLVAAGCLTQRYAMPMTAYTMAPLEYPQSSSELQGTNTTTYESPFATVISAKPKLVIQYLGAAVPTLTWNGTAWATSDATIPTIVPVNFVPELNVGGKYIYGASMGGWWPSQTGYYRVTFYVPAESGVNLAGAQIDDHKTGFSGAAEGNAAKPLVDATHNLSYVDVLARSGAGGGGKGGR